MAIEEAEGHHHHGILAGSHYLYLGGRIGGMSSGSGRQRKKMVLFEERKKSIAISKIYEINNTRLCCMRKQALEHHGFRININF